MTGDELANVLAALRATAMRVHPQTAGRPEPVPGAILRPVRPGLDWPSAALRAPQSQPNRWHSLVVGQCRHVNAGLITASAIGAILVMPSERILPRSIGGHVNLGIKDQRVGLLDWGIVPLAVDP
jgi:hypothetical protein